MFNQCSYSDKHLCTHEYVLFCELSCPLRPSSKTTHVGILYRISFLPASIMPFTKKLFSSRSFFNERMLFFSMPCNNHWLFHVNDWTSLPTSRSNYHMSTLRYDEPQQIFLYFCNWSFKYSNYENEEFLNVLNRIASMYGLLRYWRTYKFSR